MLAERVRSEDIERKEDPNGLDPSQHTPHIDPDHLNHLLITL